MRRTVFEVVGEILWYLVTPIAFLVAALAAFAQLWLIAGIALVAGIALLVYGDELI